MAQKLVDLLRELEPDELNVYHKFRLIYPMGRLQTIDLEKPIYKQKIPCGAQLILIGSKNLAWDINRKGPDMDVRRPVRVEA